ncbi:MAG: type I-B CRISPR-associated protein Cas7/Csh2 [Chloroflexi bacterium]|nr:type I-B CRISPR-associated protein Cas7/Csh2 [Chloroflexota bacterium]
MATPVRNRSEILFLYDVTDANPNGDPVDENRPRVDEETGQNIVTDVRLKRTIRDYLIDYKDQEVFVRGITEADGKLRTKEKRQEELGATPEKVLEKCIDLRLFGATIAVRNQNLTATGPVQFKFGRSLHPVEVMHVRGTTVMPSGEGRAQGTFTEVYVVPYSLIGFYGVVNENAAALHRQLGWENREVWLTQEDVRLMLEGAWSGTKNLISRSKFGQMPRLLLHVVYKGGNYHLGELDHLLDLQTNGKDGRQLRSVGDLTVDVTRLAERLGANGRRIGKIEWAWDRSLRLSLRGKPLEAIEQIADGVEYEQLPL